MMAFGSIEWKKQIIEYQAKPEQEEVTAAFHFANTGNKPIEIVQTKSSCGCTVVKMDKTTFAPGEVGTVKAKFTFGDRTGHQEKLIRVYTDDPENMVVNLKLIVDIPKVVLIEPQLLYWSRGEAATAKTSIVTFDYNAPVDITAIEYDQDSFVVEKTVIEEGLRYAITVVPLATENSTDTRIALTTTMGAPEKSRSISIGAKVY